VDDCDQIHQNFAVGNTVHGTVVRHNGGEVVLITRTFAALTEQG